MRRSVILSSKDSDPDSNAININLIVPPGDLPQYIDLDLDSSQKKLTGSVEYGSNEPKESIHQNDTVVFIGKNSGRIYGFEINNFNDNQSKLHEIISKLQESWEKSNHRRKLNNLEIANTILQHTFEENKNI